jgi:hypothetical protein
MNPTGSPLVPRARSSAVAQKRPGHGSVLAPAPGAPAETWRGASRTSDDQCLTLVGKVSGCVTHMQGMTRACQPGCVRFDLQCGLTCSGDVDSVLRYLQCWKVRASCHSCTSAGATNLVAALCKLVVVVLATSQASSTCRVAQAQLRRASVMTVKSAGDSHPTTCAMLF